MSLQKDYESYLMHYGVKGMKWGVRKEYIPHPRKRKQAVVYAGKSSAKSQADSIKEQRAACSCR